MYILDRCAHYCYDCRECFFLFLFYFMKTAVESRFIYFPLCKKSTFVASKDLILQVCHILASVSYPCKCAIFFQTQNQPLKFYFNLYQFGA